MTPAEEAAEAIAAKVEVILARRTASRQAPKNGRVARIGAILGIVVVAGGLAAGGREIVCWLFMPRAEAAQADLDLKVKHDADMLTIDSKIEIRDERLQAFKKEVRKDFRAIGRAVGAKMDPMPVDE